MQTTTVLLIILAAMAALLIVLFQYFFRSITKGRLRLVLSMLRFLVVFCAFLLLLNPKFTKKSFSLEKSNLLVLVDNSSSIKQSTGQDQVDSILDILRSSSELGQKFNVQRFKFGKEFSILDSLDFSDNITNIGKGIRALNSIFGNSESAVVLLTDGNSTLGEDYEFYGKKQKFPIFSVVLGDTTKYEDLRIVQVNTNKYAFLKNKFPVEVFVSYDGDNEVATTLNITMNGINVHTRRVELSKNKNAESITVMLNASSVGLKTLRISLDPLAIEENKTNNVKYVAVEVIDEKTNVAIVSELLHPDMGALKKSIESNEQRSVSIIQPSVDLEKLREIDLLILYQPTPSFRSIYEYVSSSKVATFAITGPKTNWNFLNGIQNGYSKNSYGQVEEVSPLLNQSFDKFTIPDIQFENYPPLETNLGETMIIKRHDVLLSQKIKGSEIDEPLLVLMGDVQESEAVLFGENLWKWRIQNYRDHQNFNDFDLLIGKIVFFLTANEPRSRLVLNYSTFFESSMDAKITANYFDASFTFDPNAKIILDIKQKGRDVEQEFPLLLKGGYYEADLSNMPPGEYTFTVKVVNENLSKSGSFNIMDYDVEQQFTSSNYSKLERLSESTGGKVFYPSKTKDLINDLMGDANFKPVRKSDENVVSLVDFRFLLGIMVVALAAEWFIRKYNGLT
jgi:hypothetical protein